MFVLFLVVLYYYVGTDTTDTFSEYNEEAYLAQKACLYDDECIQGYYCNLDELQCEKK
jgi:hypothetical protein